MTAKKDKNPDGLPSARLLKKLLQEQPTPFYLYDAEGFRKACMDLRLAFSWYDGFELCFPARMNPNPAILRVLADAGCQILCGSEAELRLSRYADIDGAQMIYAPMAEDAHAGAYARRIGAAYLIDAPHALPSVPPEHVLLSVNPGGSLQMDGRTVWDFEKSKLGMNADETVSMCRRFQASGVESIGLAAFLRDQEFEPLRFFAVQEMLFHLAVRIKRELDLAVDSILISGGLGVGYRPSDNAPDLTAVSERVRRSYETLLTPAGVTPKLILAEGRLMAAKAGVLVSRVLAVKRQQTPLAILDADCAQLLREIAFGASHRIAAPLAPESRAKQLVRVAGAISDLRDHFSGSFVLPELKLGECVAILDTGADGRSFGSNYGGSLGCAEFLIENGAVRCIRKRQTMDELMASFDVE